MISMIANSLVSLTEAVNDLNCTNEHDPVLTSCEAIHKKWPNKPSGYYKIPDSNGDMQHVYCNMENLCNLEGGWMRIANLNMTQGTSCPTGFRLYTNGGVHACGRPVTSSGSCVGKVFSSSGIEYSQVCGKVIGYQVGHPDAAGERVSSIKNNINTYYADGVSVTHGNPRKHIWTLMSGATDRSTHYNYKCPCASTGPIPAPSFVGSNYYCEAGYQGSDFPQHGELYSSDPLWDGKDCGSSETTCCQSSLIPWFYKSISDYTTDDIEMRICCDEGTDDEDVAIEQYDIYVK
uniref:Fibrinogen C-terminal domain-containing protein n=1 Tax=Amphimedon queenslandica TaxID=400682 RepID=A0A1X7SRV9_AMPQE